MSRQSARKKPVQARSQATVDRIIDAAGRILITSGYEKATTHRIAEAAGVSPGSVYQYFPNKHAILQEAVDRLVERHGDLLARLVAERLSSGDAVMHGVVEATLAAAEEQRELTRFLVTELPHLGGSAVMASNEARAQELARIYLASQAQRPMLDDLSSARVWIATAMLQQCVVRYVTEQPNVDRDAFIDATVIALDALLTVPGPDAQSVPG